MPGYLRSASALIKALRSPADPPGHGLPIKVDIARFALNTSVGFPRKQEIILDWIIDTWLRVKPR
jgi:hypothetical protein